MKIAYFDCFAGASGDMILGALMDAGLGLDRLKQDIAKLGLTHYDLDVEKVTKHGIGGSQARVIIDQAHHHHHHRHPSHIRDIIAGSSLDVSVRDNAIRIFTRLAEAEARVHRSDVESVHFHEVGAMDAIIDVVGAVAGLHALGIEKVFSSPLHVGSGTIQCAHGVLPVPAPATAELIKGRPVYSTGVQGELLTPTGAAILTTLASGFGPMPAMTVQQIG
ncbi:MAG TPA: LarC family nickel insertion protein, partial [Desulfosarcina sp.]|nr:LarC family nickel insertion protein [Desulfosarcina sp.]